jgi:hypothetical protein
MGRMKYLKTFEIMKIKSSNFIECYVSLNYLQINQNAEALKQNYFELTELKHSLEKTQSFFQVQILDNFFSSSLAMGRNKLIFLPSKFLFMICVLSSIYIGEVF